MFVAIAANHRPNLFKSDTEQEFLHGYMGDEKIYVFPPDGWPSKVPPGYALQLMKSMSVTRQAAIQ